MKTATVRELRNDFSRISKWLSNGETVRILKRGKPFARVIPEQKNGTWLGSMAGTGSVPDDLDEPLPVQWEAAR
ncbi:MAG TPA: type II toxin-antitoxin system prevent-host-death family antitoxin [Candidatus Binatia bacterium]|nr:type II toxin-antitoxin system prevent-host-death family antitoxin [Candidatus Binatia bacterium]